MPRSMTGYGMAEGPVGESRLSLEVRSVNHRHFSSQFRLPQELQRFESDLKARLRAHVERGHVAVAARWTETATGARSIQVDVERARTVVDALGELKDALGLAGEIDLAFVARQPDVITYGEDEERQIDSDEILAVLDRAAADVVAMREREGAALAADLEGRLDSLAAHLGEVVARAPQRVVAERDRLRKAVAELLDGRAIDEGRLSQEIALLADKLDITEEVVRLRTHVDAFRGALGAQGPVGKQLAFLGQEMLREVNTIGSKANDAEITQAVIAMKGELEKVREQVENIE